MKQPTPKSSLSLHVLPAEQQAKATVGRYVVDFGTETVVGMTAAEVGKLLESEQFAHIRLMRIHRAHPDGTIELAGVSNERFHLEEGMLFCRSDDAAARADFDRLREIADRNPAPCRMRIHLSRIPDAPHPSVVAMLYPAEFSNEVSQWLLDNHYDGGDFVEGGVSVATDYTGNDEVLVVDRLQLWGTHDGTLQSAGEPVHTARTAAAS